MATHGNPLPALGSIHYTVCMIDDAFELVSFGLLGIGVLLLGWVGVTGPRRSLARGRYTVAVGLLLLATSVSYALTTVT